jgi:hypothetical protein
MTSPTQNYDFHPLAETFPMIEKDELRELADDIQRHGLREQIVLFEGKILDGRNRYRAAMGIKYPLTDANFKTLPAGVDPQAYVISVNVRRRHLTTEQKREVIAKLLKADPSKSDRRIAEVAAVDNKTVGTVRQKLEAREEIPHVETTTDKAGRKQKKNKTKKSKSVVDQYDAIEERLLEKLKEFSSADHANEHAVITIQKLEDTIERMRKEEKKAA